MTILDPLPRPLLEEPNVWIPLADGTRLAARIWRPEGSETAPVPAILEYLPYRKRDGTAERDALTHPWFAAQGYACVRVDLRGSGESDGLLWDEYLRQEQDDCLEVLDWLAAQPWCDGGVGMIGISWGGFNGLQVAARRPPALKAVVTLCSTVDRYADDIHYKGGCLLAENLGWSSTMLAYSSRPPDPALVGERWREIWLERLDNEPHLIETWLEHQQRDDYWKHGSICEDFSAIEAAVLAVGGWGDAYKNAVPALLENLNCPRKGIVGPWVHKYPHFAVPEPRIGFLQEALRWWDRWLKGLDTGVEQDPDYRAFRIAAGEPKPWYEVREGDWIAEPLWPSPHVTMERLPLGSGERPLSGRSPEDTGECAGEYCSIWLGPELPGDQRLDDGRSLVFDLPVLEAPLDILGAPEVELTVAVDRPQAHLAVRLNAVAPDGSVERLTYGLLNLSQRRDREAPEAMEPGREETVLVSLDHCAWRLPAGHRLRVSVSTSYWPLVWPDPEPVTLSVWPGASALMLPVRAEAGQPAPAFEPPQSARPLDKRAIRPPSHERRTIRDQARQVTVTEILDDFGAAENVALGLVTGAVARERYEIAPGDPASAVMSTHWTEELSRPGPDGGGWAVRTETFAEMTATAEAFTVTGRLEAYEGAGAEAVLVKERRWSKTIPRRWL